MKCVPDVLQQILVRSFLVIPRQAWLADWHFQGRFCTYWSYPCQEFGAQKPSSTGVPSPLQKNWNLSSLAPLTKYRRLSIKNRIQTFNMLAMITSEELECRDILNDIGIFFSEDCDLLEAELSALDDDFKAIVSPSEFLSTPVAPVSPTPSAEALEHLIAPLVPNPISSCPPARLAFYSPQPLLPVLPSIMPHQTMSSNPGITIQRAVSDISMTTAPVAKIIMPTANATISRKRSLQGMLQVDLDPEEQVRR